MSIGKHYETGESIPDDIYKKLLAARTFRAGSLSLRQVGASLPDIEHPLPPFAFRLYSCPPVRIVSTFVYSLVTFLHVH